MPDGLVPSIPVKVPIKVLSAKDNNGRAITNKLNLFLSLRWDKEINDGKGGIDVNEFARQLGATIIWAAYLLEYQLGPMYNEFILATKQDFKLRDFDKLLRAVIIDVGNKLIYRDGGAVEQLHFGELGF